MTICLHGRAAPAGLEQRPGAADVRVERGDRIAVGDADGRLRRQVEDRRDLVLAERALERLLIAHVAADDADPVEQSGGDQLRARHPVAHQATTSAPGASELPHEPAAEQAGGAGHEDGPVAPERRRRRRSLFPGVNVNRLRSDVARAQVVADASQHRRRTGDVVRRVRAGAAARGQIAVDRDSARHRGRRSRGAAAGVLDEVGHVERRHARARSARRRRGRSAGAPCGRRRRGRPTARVAGGQTLEERGERRDARAAGEQHDVARRRRRRSRRTAS